MEAITLMNFHGKPVVGILHVGANDGAEFEDYRSATKGFVFYVEPIPGPFATLQQRIAGEPKHVALNALCGSNDGQKVKLNVASNRGESSSIFTPSLHKDFFPEIEFLETIEMEMITVDTLFSINSIDASSINLIVIDTQGSELLVLEGSKATLSFVKGAYIEVSDRPLYKDSCTFDQINDFMQDQGFTLKSLHIGVHNYGNAFYLRD